MVSNDTAWLDAAFPTTTHKALNKSVRDALNKNPQIRNLLQDISAYIVELKSPPPPSPPTNGTTTAPAGDAPSPKKRKLDSMSGSGEHLLTLEGLSFSVPQRKKFNVVITDRSISASLNPSGPAEFSAAFSDIENICCLPVPEKNARQWNICILPKGASGLGENTADGIVFTLPDGAPQKASGPALSSGHDTTTTRTLLLGLLSTLLPASCRIEEPDASIFHSLIPQPHRKSEKAFHVKAHRGSKDGYLFFLRRGILWAFKKPLVYFSFADIASVSYSSITKRTFNMSIKTSADVGEQDLEFAMIDQEDYNGIDLYIKSNRLHDESFAEERKARHFKVNGKDEDGDGDGRGELERAWEDAEDEEEEDYVPGQDDGDDSGSGSESESESEDEENMDSDDEEGSVDLQDELGSEMEDVEMSAPKPKRVKKVRA